MPAETAIAVLYKALNRRLRNANSLWAERVYADIAPPETRRPFVLYQWQGGGEGNRVRRPDATLVVVARMIADDLATALEGAAAISTLLNDSGHYDTSTPLAFGSEWRICTVTQELAVHLHEVLDGRIVYHAGAQYRVVMESMG